MDTYIKVFRRMLNWGWYKDANTFRVFMHILLKANYSPSEYFGHKIGAGECVFGRKAWAEELDMSEQSIRTAINHLKSTNEITTKSTNRFTIITVVKWDFWQMGECEPTNKSTTEPTNNQPTANQQLTTSKEYKNKRNKEDIYIAPTLEEVNAYIKEKGLSVNGKKFYDYFEAGNWKDAKGNKVRSWKQKLLTWEKYNDTGAVTDSTREWNRTNGNSGQATSYDSRNRKRDSDAQGICEYAEAIAKNASNPIDYSAL